MKHQLGGSILKLQKVGMRTIKTGIAVAICAFLSKYIIENPMFAGVGCVVSVQDTVKGSLKLGFNRVKGTLIGGIVGYLCVLISPGNPILAGIGIMASIYGCTTLNISSGIIVSSVTFLSIHLGIITSNPAYYATHRVIDTSVGVVIGVLINYILARPDYVESTTRHLSKIEKIAKESLHSKIIHKDKFNIIMTFREFISDLEVHSPEFSKSIKDNKLSVPLSLALITLRDLDFLKLDEIRDAEDRWTLDLNESIIRVTHIEILGGKENE